MARKIRTPDPLCNCKSCSLDPSSYVPMWNLGNRSDLPILFIGQAPGSTEDITGIPFTGKAGKMFWSLLNSASINKQKNNLTNICACVPPEDREPTDEEIRCCLPRLINEIATLQPKLIIALGNIALHTLTGKKGIRSLRGNFYPLKLDVPDYNGTVLASLHPSFVMRQRQWIETAVKDLTLIHKHLNPRIEVHNERVNFSFSHNPTSDELHNYLTQSNVTTAFDLETTGLNPRLDSILGISFSNSRSSAISLDWNNHNHLDIVTKFLQDRKAPKCTQNGSFDCAFLKTNNIDVKGLHYDTRLAEHLLNSDLPTDLQFLRRAYTNIPNYKPSKAEMKNVASMPMERVHEFACYDALTTYTVMQEQLKKMSDTNLHVLESIYMPLIFTLNDMTRKGIKVNIDTLALLYAQIKPMMDNIEAEHFTSVGLNPRSPEQLCNYWNINSTAQMKSNIKGKKPEDFIDYHIRYGHPDIDRMKMLLEYRSLQVTASKVLMGTYKRLENGYVHTSYYPEGTGTGRISSKDPNLQNVEKPYRIIFIPDDDDHVLVQADYNQVELAVAAVLGNDTSLLEMMKNGISPHHTLGRLMFGRDWSELSEKEKRQEKAVLFGTMGGRSPRAIALELEVPISLARHWQEKCTFQYPGLKRFADESIEQYKSTGKIFTPFGTERVISSYTQALNNRFQGTASFVTLTTLNEMFKAGFDLRLTVHDSIIWQCHKSQIRDSIIAARDIIERPIPQLNDWCFKATYEHGPNWYEMEKLQCSTTSQS